MSETPMERLKDVRVLVTRPRDRAEELCFLLEDEGAQVLSLPLLELLPPENPRPLAAAAEQLERYAWVVFASPSAVQAMVDACREAGTLDRLEQVKIAVVGPGTARAARVSGLTVQLESELKTGVGLLDALGALLPPQTWVLVPAAQEGRTELADGLAALGVEVTRVAAYRSAPVHPEAASLDALKSLPPEVVLLASPRTVDALLDTLGGDASAVLSGARLVAIGPTTAQALVERGFEVNAIAERPTAAGLVEAAVEAVRG